MKRTPGASSHDYYYYYFSGEKVVKKQRENLSHKHEQSLRQQALRSEDFLFRACCDLLHTASVYFELHSSLLFVVVNNIRMYVFI